MREIETASAAGDPDASLALDVFVHRLTGAVAAMVAAAGGLDTLVFTAGIGENSALVRDRTCRSLAFLGVTLDRSANAAAELDCDVASTDSRVRVLVVGAREDLVAARAARELLEGQRTA
jgi:acetate kinase